jgi:fido (protein-threonine AMPylation protein)
MHPSDCPFWEYESHPQRDSILSTQTATVLRQLRDRTLAIPAIVRDSRPVHHALFAKLTPPEHPYYAGHYRGEQFRCLRYANVGIQDDPRVGVYATLVFHRTQHLCHYLDLGLAYLDKLHRATSGEVSDEDKLLNTVAFACAIFDEFLRIHPYLNGNGHMARFLVWAILGRYNYWPDRFPIEPRPHHVVYMTALLDYRNGNKDPLEQYLLECIIGD